MELNTFLIGGIVGFGIGILIFTATGREVSRAAGARAAHHIRPKSRS